MLSGDYVYYIAEKDELFILGRDDCDNSIMFDGPTEEWSHLYLIGEL